MIRSSLARHMIYPLHERLMQRPTFPYLAELERSQWISHSGVQKIAGGKTGKLTEICLRTRLLVP